ncbi:MAG: hypothetical protein QXF26_06165 [Candidatus Bathyarchaeia archaeon]
MDPLRWYWYPIVITSLELSFIFGLLYPMDVNTARSMVRQLEEMRASLDSYPALLANNLGGALMMMAPFVGFPYAIFTAFLNGNYTKAYSIVNGSNPLTAGSSLLLMPSTILQFIAFAISANESLVLNNAFFSRRLTQEAKVAALMICMVSSILALGLAVGMTFGQS